MRTIHSQIFVLIVVLSACEKKSQPVSSNPSDSSRYTPPGAEYAQSDSSFAEVESLEIDWQTDAADTSANRLLKRKGETWKMWRSMFQTCMSTAWVNDPYYFGPTNTINLGSVVTSNYDRLIWELKDVLTEAEIATVINSGVPTRCSETRQIEMKIESLMEAQVPQAGNGELSVAINNAKKTTTSIDAFQVDNLKVGPFLSLFSNTTDEKKKSYFADLKKGNKILAKVIKVSGFTSTIELNNAMSAGLKADLQQGKVVEFGDVGVKMNFSYVNDNTISISSTGPFVVFAKFLKANKLKD